MYSSGRSAKEEGKKKERDDDDLFLNGNVAYTIISRLKQNLKFNLSRELERALEAGIITSDKK